MTPFRVSESTEPAGWQGGRGNHPELPRVLWLMHQAPGSGLLLAGILFCGPGWTEPPVIQSVQVKGTSRVLVLESHPGEPLDGWKISRDVRRLWRTGWFDDIRVETSETTQGAALIFSVVERPRFPLRRVRYEPAGFRTSAPPEPGAVVDRELAQRTAAGLRRTLVAEGHADARVEPEIQALPDGRADLLLRVMPGPRYHVREVLFSGQLGLAERDLQKALRATRSRVLRRPAYTEAAVRADIQRLRSLYIANGYLRAQVALPGVDFDGSQARLRIAVDSGPRYAIEHLELPGFVGAGSLSGLCSCLLNLERQAEKGGALDFTASLEAAPGASEQSVVLAARVDTGPPYVVRRIDFRGLRSFSDLTLRRALVLDEGQLFDRSLLRQSLARLNRLGVLEPLTEASVRIEAGLHERQVRLTIDARERARGRWQLSGPAGPVQLGGPLAFSIASRLPQWGAGLLETSTYVLSIQAQAFSPALWRLLGLLPNRSVFAWVSLGRPYLVGQGWRSGFWWSPQLGWRATAAGYALGQFRYGLAEPALSGAPPAPSLSVAVEGTSAAPAAVLLCEAPRSRWAWIRAAGSTALALAAP